MKQEQVAERQLTRRDQIRRMGFNPDQLTAEEQQELLLLDMLLASPRGRKELAGR